MVHPGLGYQGDIWQVCLTHQKKWTSASLSTPEKREITHRWRLFLKSRTKSTNVCCPIKKSTSGKQVRIRRCFDSTVESEWTVGHNSFPGIFLCKGMGYGRLPFACSLGLWGNLKTCSNKKPCEYSDRRAITAVLKGSWARKVLWLSKIRAWRKLILCSFQTHIPPWHLNDFTFLLVPLHSENKPELLKLLMPRNTEESNAEEPVRSGTGSILLQQMLMKLLSPFQALKPSIPWAVLGCLGFLWHELQCHHCHCWHHRFTAILVATLTIRLRLSKKVIPVITFYNLQSKVMWAHKIHPPAGYTTPLLLVQVKTNLALLPRHWT